MLFQDPFVQRFLAVTLLQTWPIIYFSFYAYKILKRTKNTLTITLGSFFVMNAVLYISMLISVFTIETPVSFVFYLTGYYIFMFSHGFLVIFSNTFLKLEQKTNYKKYYFSIITYALVATYVIWVALFLNGIQYNASTGWRPVFNMIFLNMTGFYVVFFLALPEILISIKLVKLFRGTNIKKRIRMFLISIFMEFFIVFFTALMNFDDTIFRVILPISNTIIGSLAAFFLYQSFGVAIQGRT